MSVMNERFQRLIRSVGRPNVRLQILALDGPGTVRGELFTISRFERDINAARRDMMSAGRPGKDFWLGGGKEIYLRLIACQMLAMTSPDPGRCKELTPKTTESNWSGGQCEP
jgi:hypothetical protein